MASAPRGPNWDAHELQIACRAYKMATLNRIKGADQTVLHFGDSIVSYIREMQPHDLMDTDLRYANRTNARESILKNLKKKCFLDIQKFQKRLLSIKNKDPTGNINERDIHCMAIAYYLGRSNGLDYNYTTGGSKSFDPATTWIFYLAYLEVKDLPKFNICPHQTVVATQTANVNRRNSAIGIDDSDDDEGIVVNGNDNGNNLVAESHTLVDTAGITAGQTTPRGSRGVKKAKIELKQNNQVEAGIKAIKDVHTVISNVTHNVELIRHAMAKKHQHKYKSDVIHLLQRKHDLVKATNPVEAEVILKKINKKYDEQLAELEDDCNDDGNYVTPLE